MRINNLRNENNDDYLDDTKILQYLNDAIDELNLDDDFVYKKKSVTYAIDTEGVGQFYAFSTLISAGDLDHLNEVRFNERFAKDDKLICGRDYKIEPNPNASGQGIRFITSIQTTLQFIYTAFIPKVDDDADVIDLPYTCNGYFINKVLQFVYESEHKMDMATYFAAKANALMDKLRGNNTYEYDDRLLSHPNFPYES